MYFDTLVKTLVGSFFPRTDNRKDGQSAFCEFAIMKCYGTHSIFHQITVN